MRYHGSVTFSGLPDNGLLTVSYEGGLFDSHPIACSAPVANDSAHAYQAAAPAPQVSGKLGDGQLLEKVKKVVPLAVALLAALGIKLPIVVNETPG